MQGVINKLLKNHPDIEYLLKHYIFLIVPMVNIDGVILGNFRCCHLGTDPNRLWLNDL